jgi:hypothetical protein
LSPFFQRGIFLGSGFNPLFEKEGRGDFLRVLFDPHCVKRVVCWGLMAWSVASCGSESFTEVESPRAPLFPGYESYAPREEVMRRLPRHMDAKVVEETSLVNDGSKPPYRILALRIAPYSHLDQSGALLITFYNDRLLQTAFYPDELNDYVTALKKSGIGVKFGQELVKGHTTIWIGTDFDNQQYVGWADKRLREQQRRWLAKYS